QPIIVRKEGSRYIIVAGERRWRASKLAGLKTIPVIIKDLSTREVMEIALIENLQREDLNPIEEAEAYQKLMEEYEMTQEEVAKIVGKSRAAIANSVRLLTLTNEIKEMLLDGRITSGHARTLITIPDMERQNELAKEIVEKNLSVREIEKLAALENKKSTPRKKPISKNNIEVTNLEEKLRTAYGTKINLVRGKNKGKIVFEYYSNDEFDRIIDILLKYGN
ncbi:MAG TPA: chromosome partitioning protein ParB, partial [Ruminiclostridium sp.]|nr:chromosome partitioning protein ParB [Ruminiclostridium sp.]